MFQLNRTASLILINCTESRAKPGNAGCTRVYDRVNAFIHRCFSASCVRQRNVELIRADVLCIFGIA